MPNKIICLWAIYNTETGEYMCDGNIVLPLKYARFYDSEQDARAHIYHWFSGNWKPVQVKMKAILS